MTLSLLRARIGDLVKGALVALALLGAGAAGCGKRPEPGPEPPETEKPKSEKTERPKVKETEKEKPRPILSDLMPVEGASWDVAADPAEAIKGPFNLKDTIPFEGEVVVPSAPSQFVAVRVPKAKQKGTYRVHELQTLDAIGQRVVLPPHQRVALSPDGGYLVARLSKEPGVLEVRSAHTGQILWRRDFSADKLKPAERLKPTDMDVLPGGRLWVAEAGSKVQLWDLKDRKPLPPLSVAPPTAEHRAFSPGGRYLLTASKDGRGLVQVHDLDRGKVVGERRFQAPDELKGRPAGLAFSPDGAEIALLWRLDRPAEGVWGRLVCWDLKTGKKLHDHDVAAFETIDLVWQTRKRIVQFWPGRKGWMVFGFLLIDRESGAVIRVQEMGLPLDGDDLQDRRFLDANHVTEARQRVPWKLKVVALPRQKIDEAVKEARRNVKRE
jgi:hypothetical protein